jgi:hypothetical protein
MNAPVITMIPQADPGAGYRAQKAEIDAAVARALASGWYILGKEGAAFEEEYASWLGTRRAIGCANGTDALALILRGLGIGPGMSVATVSHTAVATVSAIEMVGATPLLLDIDPDTYTMDPDELLSVLDHPPPGLLWAQRGHTVVGLGRCDHRGGHQRVVQRRRMHALAGPFGFDDPAHRAQCGLGGVVDAEQWGSLGEYAPGRDVDDVAVAAFDHAGSQAADEPQWRVVIQRHGALDVMPAIQRFGQRTPDGPPGVVHQNVHPAEPLLDGVAERIDGVEVGQVAGNRGCGAAVGADPCRHRVEQTCPARDENHLGPRGGELFGAGFADARGGSGDQYPLAAQRNSGAPGHRQRWPHAGQRDRLGQFAAQCHAPESMDAQK